MKSYIKSLRKTLWISFKRSRVKVVVSGSITNAVNMTSQRSEVSIDSSTRE